MDMEPVSTSPVLTVDSVIAKPLLDRMADAGDAPIDVIIELRTRYGGGVRQAARRVAEELGALGVDIPRIDFLSSYVSASLTPEQIAALAAADAGAADDPAAALGASRAPRGAIHRIWPNFETRALITRSIVATKCQAVHRSFDGTGSGITWAVLDSGIDGNHDHFDRHGNLEHDLHRSFVSGEPEPLVDDAGHGTHVAGILAGAQTPSARSRKKLTAATWWQNEQKQMQVRAVPLASVSGMAPQTQLISCKVLRSDESGDVASLLAALEYVQQLTQDGRDLRVHGVNISVGYPFDPSWFAAGLTPVCREVDRLVRMGVVVVIAAGNSGFGYAYDAQKNPFRLGFDMTINDPGNAALGITVGSTSCDPHVTGVSYFSSKGPTGDGRMKPDLVAPGERVISAAAGALLERAQAEVPGATYIENSGTSMAAPHVAGAIAGFLSVHREFIGRPEEVKRIFADTATDLGRAASFQGAGALDAMRAIQSV